MLVCRPGSDGSIDRCLLQATGKGQCGKGQCGKGQCGKSSTRCSKPLRRAVIWYGMQAQNLIATGTEEGVSQSRNLLLFLSAGSTWAGRFCIGAEVRPRPLRLARSSAEKGQPLHGRVGGRVGAARTSR